MYVWNSASVETRSLHSEWKMYGIIPLTLHHAGDYSWTIMKVFLFQSLCLLLSHAGKAWDNPRAALRVRLLCFLCKYTFSVGVYEKVLHVGLLLKW